MIIRAFTRGLVVHLGGCYGVSRVLVVLLVCVIIRALYRFCLYILGGH